jgi:hypothetical protein
MGILLRRVALAAAAICLTVATVAADGDWKAEFDRVCGQTERAGEMSMTELKKAVADCDALQPKIEALEATPRKVYLKRLQMCRNLFIYMLENREKSQPDK